MANLNQYITVHIMQSTNTQSPANLNQLNQKPILPPVTKNYEVVKPKASTGIGLTILLYIVTAIVFFGAGYVTRMWQVKIQATTVNDDYTNPTNDIVTNDEDINEWVNYSNDLLGINIKHPSNWSATETVEEVDSCTAVFITITNGEYILNIDSACGATSQICSYNPTDENTEEDILTFTDFTEIATASTSYRRALNEHNRFQICVMKNDEYKSYVVPFGFITYNTPEDYAEETIAIMDQMLLTLIDTPFASESTTSNGCTVDDIQYVVGETFDAVDGCNTCTCEEDGNAICTEIECTTPNLE